MANNVQDSWRPKHKGVPICVCICAYRSLELETHEVFVRDMLRLASLHRLNYRTYGNDALIYRTRSVILTEFEEYTDSQVLVMCDADMVWCPGTLERLVDSALETKGIVSAVVPKRGFGSGIACRLEGGPQQFVTGTDRLVSASYVGAAMMAVHRDAVAAIREHENPAMNYGYDRIPMCRGAKPYRPYCMPFVREAPGGGKPDGLSEDWAFCARAIDAGVSIWIDLWPIVEHKGEWRFSVDDAFAQRPTAAVTLPANDEKLRVVQPRIEIA